MPRPGRVREASFVLVYINREQSIAAHEVVSVADEAHPGAALVREPLDREREAPDVVAPLVSLELHEAALTAPQGHDELRLWAVSFLPIRRALVHSRQRLTMGRRNRAGARSCTRSVSRWRESS